MIALARDGNKSAFGGRQTNALALNNSVGKVGINLMEAGV